MLSAFDTTVARLGTTSQNVEKGLLVLLSQKVAAFADEESSIWQT